MNSTLNDDSSRRSAIPKTGRLASLDGLRAISIGLVLLGHLSGTRCFVTIPHAEAPAFLGVVVCNWLAT